MNEIDANSFYKNALPKRHYWVDPKFKHENVVVPDTMKDTVLVIPYSNIFNVNMLYVLAEFTGKVPNEATKQNFQNYIEGQRKFAIDTKTQK
jgi:hypothetical protein